jgi:heme-degrading monooxygenase HmoA
MPQIQIGKQPVTQITIIEAEPEKQAEALAIMTERARLMARQPGFISISLHRSLDGRRIVNYIQWETRDLLRAAHQSAEFRKGWSQFSPTISIPICTRSPKYSTISSETSADERERFCATQ